MKSGYGMAALVAAVVLIIIGYSSFYVVDPREQAIVRQFGEVKRVVSKPGPYFKIPLLQDVLYFDKRVLDFDVDRQEVILLDQKRLDIDAYARVRIFDPLLFFQSVQTESLMRTRMGPVIQSAIRRVLGEVPLEVVLTEKRTDLMRRITERVNTEGRTFGVEVLDVRLKRADLPPANSEGVYRRMQSQREQEARQIRAEGSEESQRIRAGADREQVVIKAEATRQGQTIRGEGDSEAIKIYAGAYGRDPDFFSFYRSLEAYRHALEGSNTTFVLSPDSEFFRYFGSSDKLPQLGPQK